MIPTCWVGLRPGESGERPTPSPSPSEAP